MSDHQLNEDHLKIPPAGGHAGEEAPPSRLRPPTSPPKRNRTAVWIAGIVVLGGAIFGFWLSQKNQDKTGATGSMVPVAAVVTVGREDLSQQFEIYAEFRPYVEVELHAKVSGYLQKINVDFGDRVKAGQLLAVLEVPELKDELDAAKAAQERAEADHKDAQLVFQRLVGVNQEHPNLVAQQEIDNAEAKDNATAAAVSAAKADVEKYQTLFGYTQITAPFDGVVTGRYADPGALIQAGTSSGQAKPLLRVSDNYHLRMDLPVSVDFVRYMKEGGRVDARVDSLGGKKYSGVITRFTREVNDDTRTMMTEIEVPNPNLEITPGMYAAAVVPFQQRPMALAVPIEAVSSGDKPTVYLVNSNNEVEERVVTLGLETPTRYEILAGLKEGDRIIVGTRSKFQPGQKVEPKPAQAPSLAEF